MLTFIEAFFISTFGDRKDDERGASAVEYGLLVAGIAALIVAVVFLFGGAISDIFKETCDSVTAKSTTASCTADPE